MMKLLDDFKLLRGFDDKRTNERTDICECRVAFATENAHLITVTDLYKLLEFENMMYSMLPS